METYAAFISYRHQSPDQEIAKALHTAIETYGIPAAIKKQTGRKRMGKVFRDQEELPISADLGADIETALDKSEWFIAICSPRYLESRWCLREMEYFIEKKGRDHVLTLLVEGEPADSFPEMIRFSENAAGERVETEPLAANVRGATLKESLKRLKGEKLRILAPMLGLSYDDLKRRARQRRIRIATATAAIGFVVAVGVTSFLVVNHANQERLKSEAAAQAQLAEERQKLADAQRLLAVSNEIGEILEKADAALLANEKRTGAELLLDAYRKSEENGGIRRDKILEKMRRMAYVEPFSVISGFSNYNARILNIVPAPDGKTAIGIENRNAVALIDMATNTVRYRVSVSNQPLYGLQFSPDGKKFLATCDNNRIACVWDAETGALLYTYTSKQNKEYQIGSALFFDSDTLLIQDMRDLYLVKTDGSEQRFYSLGEQQSGYDYDRNILTILFEKPISEIFTFYTDDYASINVRCTSDRSRVLVSGKDGTTGTIVLDAEGNRVCLLDAMPATSAEQYGFTPDGKFAACKSALGFVAWWDAETGELMGLQGASANQGASSNEVALSPDSKHIAFVASDHLYVYDLYGDFQQNALLDITLESTNISPNVRYSEDGSYLFVSAQHFYIYDAHTGVRYYKKEATFGSAYSNGVDLGDVMFLTRNDGVAVLLSHPSIATVQTLPSFDGTLLPAYNELAFAKLEGKDVPMLMGEHELTDAFLKSTAHTGPELNNKMFVSLDGTRIAITYADGIIELFKTDGDGTVDTMLAQLTDMIGALGMTDDVMVASDDLRRVLFYDLNQGEIITILNNDEYWYTDLAFDPTGTYVMGLRHTRRIIDVYETHTAQYLFSMRTTDDGGFVSMAFSEDGRYAVGQSSSHCCVGDLLLNESDALAQTEKLAGLFR